MTSYEAQERYGIDQNLFRKLVGPVDDQRSRYLLGRDQGQGYAREYIAALQLLVRKQADSLAAKNVELESAKRMLSVKDEQISMLKEHIALLREQVNMLKDPGTNDVTIIEKSVET